MNGSGEMDRQPNGKSETALERERERERENVVDIVREDISEIGLGDF